jgi:hypothetical protein
VRPGRRPGGRGRAWEILSAHRAFLEDKLDPDLDLTFTKVHTLFVRHTGEAIPYRTLHRFCVQELGHNEDRVTVRVEDCDPGSELQVDFGRMGIMFDPEASRRRVVWALIFTAAFSGHMFVWPSFTQSLADVIARLRGRVGLLRLSGRHHRQHQGGRDRRGRNCSASQRRLR